MLTQMRSFTFIVRCLLFAFILQLSVVAVTQARALPPIAQSKDCQVAIQPGWRPYRVQAVDTLETLVARTSVSMAQVMHVNCLQTTTIQADELLLLPALPPVKVVASATVEQPGQALKTTSAAAPATTASAAAPVLLKVISTTETAALVVAPLTRSALTSVKAVAPTSPVTTANMIAIALFVLVGLGIFFFALRPRADDPPMVRNLFSSVGNGIFLFAGVLLGVILFPMVNVPSFAELPTSVSASIVVSLIGLLVAKELFFNGQQWRTLNRLLNLGIAPLLMIFFLTVASRVAESIN